MSYDHWDPFCTVEPDGSFDGIFPSIAKDIGKMLNLSMKFQLFRQRGKWAGKLDNGSWGGNLGDVVNGLIHTTIGGYIPNSERALVVDFTEALAFSPRGVLIKKPSIKDVSAKNYIGQIIGTSWIAVFLAFLTCMLCIIVLFFVRSGGVTKKDVVLKSFETTFLAFINKVRHFLIHVGKILTITLGHSRDQD